MGLSLQLPLVIVSAWLWALSVGGAGCYGWLAWLALVPLLTALQGVSFRRGLVLGYAGGLCFYLIAFSWINEVGGVRWYDYLLLASYLGVFLGLFCGACAASSARTDYLTVLLMPALWVIMEFTWSHAGFLTLPTLLAYSQYQSPPVLQIASLTGPYGISYLIVMVNVFGVKLVCSKIPSRAEWICLALMLPSALGYGLWRLSTVEAADTLTIAVVQANIPQALKWDKALYRQHMEKHVRLTREAVEQHAPALVIWPESAVPGYIGGFGPFRDVLALSKELETPLLVGGAGLPKSAKGDASAGTFNAAYLISENGSLAGKYHKRHLLPFAEYLPMKDSLPWPERFTLGKGSFIPGEAINLLKVESEPVAVMICWETLFPDLVRESALAGANILVNIGNEAWFGDTAAPHQFFASNVFRAVENGISVARSLNTGISGFIDPYGRVLTTVSDKGKETFVAGYASAKVPIVRQRTFYTRHGDVFVYGVALITLFFLFRMIRIQKNLGLLEE